MKIITTNAEFEREVLKMSRQNPSFFYISTFNMRADDFIIKVIKNLPKKCEKKFLVGVLDNVTKAKLKFLKSFLIEHKISFKITTQHHTKLILSNRSGIVGGRNITGSKWQDLDVIIERAADIAKLKRYFNDLYRKSKKL